MDQQTIYSINLAEQSERIGQWATPHRLSDVRRQTPISYAVVSLILEETSASTGCSRWSIFWTNVIPKYFTG
ncbi:hypothetical protein DPMN_011142 [Dreissena polymorpha]|uniref:Uncharacterized protein n=1 Tax=Dreissena polymorpha TaxID=45954 RepID=A0A9D4N3I1_DREPO|nr:hypothetical protein DPMN_011142 [Dreissena polymorpha]